ncbi:MAG: hypothetical protein WDA65_08905, partial [Christensenellales bacterium]
MMKKKAIIIAMLLLFSLAATACGGGNDDPPVTNTYKITAEDLSDQGIYQERWLSVPDSRIVLNPFNFNTPTYTTQSEHSNSNKLPLHIGFCSPSTPKGSLGRQTTPRDVLMLAEPGASSVAYADNYITAWRPDKLDFSAEYSDGLELSGYDYFHDDKTVIRHIDYEGSLALLGAYSGTMVFAGNALTFTQTHYRISISFSFEAQPVFYKNAADIGNVSKQTTASSGKFWAVSAPDGQTELDIAVVTDIPAAEDTAALAMAAAEADLAASLKARTKDWNDFFRDIPYVSDYEISAINDGGVQPEDIKHDYYTSWALIYASVLPESAENSFNYKQVSTGKASMWDEGAPAAAYSASWESFFGIQLLSYVRPEIAWSSLKGLLSLVDANGVLGGESLPSEKAHTAWVCYQNSPDKAALAEIYPALKRYLLWRKDNPRWIHTGHDIKNEKDYDFASMLVMDARYAQLISTELGLTQDFDIWENVINETYANIKSWFFLSSGDQDPYQYNVGGNMQKGAVSWVSKSLLMDVLDGEYLTRTINYAKKSFNENSPFCGYLHVKYDNFAYIAFGF